MEAEDSVTARDALLDTLGQGPGALAVLVPVLGPYLVLSSRAEALRCAGLRYCIGVHLPRVLIPRLPLPGEETSAAREWKGLAKSAGIFGAVIGICQEDRKCTDGETLFSPLGMEFLLKSGLLPFSLSLDLHGYFRSLGCLPSRNAESSRGRVQGSSLGFARSLTSAALMGSETLIRDVGV